jgi:hypothetical protein
MLPVTPALEVHSVDQSTMSIPADCLSVYLPPQHLQKLMSCGQGPKLLTQNGTT